MYMFTESIESLIVNHTAKYIDNTVSCDSRKILKRAFVEISNNMNSSFS